MIRPRKAVQRLQKYRPPLEGRAGKLRLDFNENTVGCAPQVVRALRRALDPDWLSRYPEYEEGRAILAANPKDGLVPAATMLEAASRAVELAKSGQGA